MTEPTSTRPVAIRLNDLANLLTMTSVGDWDPTKHPDLAESWHRAAAIKDAAMAGQPVPQPEPGLPPGEFARVEIMGHDSVTGWVTDGTRAGVPVMIVRDWDGRVLREVPGQSLYQFFPLATPLRRPDPLPFPDATVALAVPAAEPYDGYYSSAAKDDEPADAFPARTEQDGPF